MMSHCRDGRELEVLVTALRSEQGCGQEGEMCCKSRRCREGQEYYDGRYMDIDCCFIL